MARTITRPSKDFTTDGYKDFGNVATVISARVSSGVQEYTATVRVHLDGGRAFVDVPLSESDLSAADIAKVEAAQKALHAVAEAKLTGSDLEKR